MFWLFRKIFGLGVFVAIIYFALQYNYNGRPLKDYLVDFYQAPIVQEAARQAKLAVYKYVYQNSKPEEDKPAMDDVSDDERQELDKIVEKRAKH